MTVAQFSLNLERIDVKLHKETIKVSGCGHAVVTMVIVTMTIVFV